MHKEQSVEGSEKNDYPKASNGLVFGAIVTFIGSIALLMAFCSPYWIESYEESRSAFLNMGIWQYCFKNFVYPNYQFPKKFTGCYGAYSHEYHEIREYLLPGWLISVQVLVTIGFLLAYACLGVLSMIITRLPLKGVLQYEWILTRISFILCAVSSLCMFVAVVIFGCCAYRRDWLMYPKFNVLSWSYSLAVVAFMILGLAAMILYREAKDAYELRGDSKNLVMQMEMQEPGYQPPRHHQSQSRSLHGYI
ncbi:uncharacterized protein LOC129918354 [Episyrphus balteatus]|uniref:uncharacterized protein LOC129918354 n=1 Tax=Episyrphus balteatus TaxID=286459 RepID=UPI002485B103|nr:uncharacterized protein LOC129918354 [Episyrphus balteatus]